MAVTFTFVTRVLRPEAFWGQMAPTLGTTDLATCDALAAPGLLRVVDSGHVAASASGRARIIVLLVWLPQPKGLCHKSLAAGPIPNLAPQATVLGSLGRM